MRVLLCPHVSPGVSALELPPYLQGSCLSVWYSTINQCNSVSVAHVSERLYVWVFLSFCVSVCFVCGFPPSLHPFTNHLPYADKMHMVL